MARGVDRHRAIHAGQDRAITGDRAECCTDAAVAKPDGNRTRNRNNRRAFLRRDRQVTHVPCFGRCWCNRSSYIAFYRGHRDRPTKGEPARACTADGDRHVDLIGARNDRCIARHGNSAVDLRGHRCVDQRDGNASTACTTRRWVERHAHTASNGRVIGHVDRFGAHRARTCKRRSLVNDDFGPDIVAVHRRTARKGKALGNRDTDRDGNHRQIGDGNRRQQSRTAGQRRPGQQNLGSTGLARIIRCLTRDVHGHSDTNGDLAGRHGKPACGGHDCAFIKRRQADCARATDDDGAASGFNYRARVIDVDRDHAHASAFRAGPGRDGCAKAQVDQVDRVDSLRRQRCRLNGRPHDNMVKMGLDQAGNHGHADGNADARRATICASPRDMQPKRVVAPSDINSGCSTQCNLPRVFAVKAGLNLGAGNGHGDRTGHAYALGTLRHGNPDRQAEIARVVACTHRQSAGTQQQRRGIRGRYPRPDFFLAINNYKCARDADTGLGGGHGAGPCNQNPVGGIFRSHEQRSYRQAGQPFDIGIDEDIFLEPDRRARNRKTRLGGRRAFADARRCLTAYAAGTGRT